MPDGPLVIGYAHNATSGKVEEAIQQGANVVCWSFVDMLPAQVPYIHLPIAVVYAVSLKVMYRSSTVYWSTLNSEPVPTDPKHSPA